MRSVRYLCSYPRDEYTSYLRSSRPIHQAEVRGQDSGQQQPRYLQQPAETHINRHHCEHSDMIDVQGKANFELADLRRRAMRYDMYSDVHLLHFCVTLHALVGFQSPTITSP